MTAAWVLTTALAAPRFFGGSLVVARHCRKQPWEHNRLAKSDYSRRLHALTATLLAPFATVGDVLTQLHTDARCVLDSFPVAGCQNTSIPCCKLLTGQAYHGRWTSKRRWFYGLKVHRAASLGDGRWFRAEGSAFYIRPRLGPSRLTARNLS